MAKTVSAKSPTARVNLSAVLGKRGFDSEVKRNRADELASREANAKRVLGTDTIRDKDVDAARLLFTTLGGQLRPITMADLRQFEHNAQQLGSRFKGGITARGVVDASLKVDRERANAQIHTAVAMSAKEGALHFVTNAGPDSDVSRHHVHVKFPAYPSFATSTADPKRAARSMLNGPLLFECDCGRFRYWYRYIATKGKFVHGRLETGFPKIRNPNLVGVSCKHGLRVMQAVLTDPGVLAKAAAMVAAGQSGSAAKLRTTAAAAKALAQQQLATRHHLKNKVETAGEKKDRIAATPAARARVLMMAAKLAEKEAAEARQTTRESAAALKRKVSAAAKGMTAEQLKALQAFAESLLKG
jgi:hypothetical protein